MEYSEDAADTHVCLSCHATVLGLDNYVTHKKSLCPMIKSRGTSTTSTTTTTHMPPVSVDVSNEMVTSLAAASTLSPSSRAVDPNMVLYSHNSNNPPVTQTASIHPDPSISDFISSLELQLRPSVTVPHQKEESSLAQDHKTADLSPKAGFSMESMEQTPTLRLSSILHDLEFSSDSEGFIPSDAEDLLNFSEDDDDEHKPQSSGGKWKPGSHSPGKGKLSGKLLSQSLASSSIPCKSPGKQLSEMTHHSPPKATGGKWKPGSKPQTMRGKWRPGETPHQTRGKWRSIGKHKTYPDDDEEEEEEEVEDETGAQPDHFEDDLVLGAEEVVIESPAPQPSSPPHTPAEQNSQLTDPAKDTEQQLKQKENTASESVQSALGPITKCLPCKRTFVKNKTYQRHLNSPIHLRKIQAAKDTEVSESESQKPSETSSSPAKDDDKTYECTLCAKSFNNKYNFARHLVSAFHARRAKTDPSHLLEEGQQILLLRLRQYQCRMCSFYCNSSEPFLQHCQSEGHREVVTGLLGPVVCVRCKYKTRNSQAMVEHLHSQEHQKKLKEVDKPCILKEFRTFFVCPVCSAFKHSAPSLLAHLQLHKNKKEFVPKRKGVRSTKSCTYCRKEFRDSFNLALHIRRRHSKDRPYQCKECNIGFADNATRTLHYKSNRHMNRVVQLCDNTLRSPKKDLGLQGKKFKCGWCNFVASEQKLLRPHYMAEHAQKMYSCKPCGVSFKKKQEFNRHQKSSKHVNKAKEAVEKLENMVCPICDQKFYDTSKYRLHELQHTDVFQEKGKDKSVEDTVHPRFHEFLRSLNVDSGKGLTRKGPNGKPQRLNCPECNKEMGKNYIVSHLRLHSGSAPFKCVYCSKSFTDGSALQRHLRIHLGIKPFKCKHCPNEFYRQCHLTTHMYKVHKDPKTLPFSCKICSKSFALLSQLNVHTKREHKNNSKQFACTHNGCCKVFLFKSELVIHMRCHSQERPYLCDQCGYGGKTRNQLTRHRRIHTGERTFHCEYCTYKAINSTNLRRHMRIHTGVKPYQCPYCQYSCNNQENIRKHILKTKIHEGKCIYPCKLCNHEFTTNSSKEFKDHLTLEHQKALASKDLASVISGLYKKDEDMCKVPEGSQALPLREPSKKQKKRILKEDHAYTIDTAGEHGEGDQQAITLQPVSTEASCLVSTVIEQEGSSTVTEVVDMPVLVLTQPYTVPV